MIIVVLLSKHFFRVVKLTSPNLNYVIILGALMLMIGNVFVPSPSQNLPLLAVFCTVSSKLASYPNFHTL